DDSWRAQLRAQWGVDVSARAAAAYLYANRATQSGGLCALRAGPGASECGFGRRNARSVPTDAPPFSESRRVRRGARGRHGRWLTGRRAARTLRLQFAVRLRDIASAAAPGNGDSARRGATIEG